MKMMRLICCLSLIAALPAKPMQAKEPVALRYKMSPDDQLVYRIAEEFRQISTANGVPARADTSTETTEVFVWTLQHVDDAGNFHIRSENKRLRMKMNAGPMRFEYDSTNPTAAKTQDGDFTEMLFSMVDTLSGTTTTFVMTPRGEIVKGPAAEMLKPFRGFAAEMLNQFSGARKKDGEPPQSQGTKGKLILPQDPVQPGDTWSAVQKLESSAVDLVRKRVFQYEEADQVDGRPTARIDIRHDEKSELDMGEAFGGKLTFSTDSSSGTARFALGAGQLVSLDTSHTVSGTTRIEIAGQKVPLKIEKRRKLTVELLEEVPE